MTYNKREARIMVPPLAPGVLAARNKEMRHRLSTSSVVLGALGQDMRDWTLSSIQPPPLVRGTSNPMQREINLTRKKALQAGQIVLGDDNLSVWAASNVMPAPTGDIAQYRGRLNTQKARMMKNSSVKIGSDRPDSQQHKSVARDGMAIPDYSASIEMFKSNCALRNKLQNVGRTTQIVDPDGEENICYESTNIMPDLTNRLQEAKVAVNQEAIRRIRRSQVIFGDDRIQSLTTTQQNSTGNMLEAMREVQPSTEPKIIRDPRCSSIQLGSDADHRWTTSNAMPNWYAPETYANGTIPELPA